MCGSSIKSDRQRQRPRRNCFHPYPFSRKTGPTLNCFLAALVHNPPEGKLLGTPDCLKTPEAAQYFSLSLQTPPFIRPPYRQEAKIRPPPPTIGPCSRPLLPLFPRPASVLLISRLIP